MSSPISPAVADDRDALLAAVTEVAENSLFAFVDVADRASFEGARTAPGAAAGWLRACVRFDGPIAGRFELVVSETLSRHLCAAFAGAETPAEIGDVDLFDFTGELTNMMCGGWLTRARRRETFNLAPPLVERDPPPTDEPAAAESDRFFYLSIDDQPIRLEIRWANPDPDRSRLDAE